MNPARFHRRQMKKAAVRERGKIPSAMAHLRKETEAAPLDDPKRALVAGWSVIATREPATGCNEPHTHWHLSARLVPIGRGSVPEDWENLGRITKDFGVPEGAFEAAVDQVRDYPGEAVHYGWVEPPGGTCRYAETVRELVKWLRTAKAN